MNNNSAFKRFSISLAFANGGGFTLIQATLATYLTLFLTDNVGIPAGIAEIQTMKKAIEEKSCCPPDH